MAAVMWITRNLQDSSFGPPTDVLFLSFVKAFLRRLIGVRKVIRFDRIKGAIGFRHVSSHMANAPVEIDSTISFAGGVVLNGWGPLYCNVYATSNYASVSARNTKLPAQITCTFNSPLRYTGVSLEVLDGGSGNVYVLTAFDQGHHVVAEGKTTVLAGGKGAIFVSGRNIHSFDLTAETDELIHFAVEKVVLT
jgi:hypothetical protein